MFFLLPVIAGAAATAISAGEVAMGISAAVGIGAAVKGVIDSNEAKEIRESAEAKYDVKVGKLRKEARLTQRKAEEFGRMKRRVYSGILKDTVALVSDGAGMGGGVDLNACAAKILAKDIEAFERRFDGSTVPFPGLVASGGIEPVMSGIMQNVGVFGSGAAALSFVPHLLPSMLGIAMKGSRMLVESERFAGTVDVECSRLDLKMELCRALRRRIMEGMKVVGFLSDRLSVYADSLRKNACGGNVLPAEEAGTLSDRALTLAVALKKAMEAEICRTDGTLIDGTERYFRKLLKEDW